MEKTASVASPGQPVEARGRKESIDVLRGFAVLGILIMNIQSFSMVSAAYSNPQAFGNFEGWNYAVWYVSHLFADLKFMGLFSLLFGAGIILMAERREASGLGVTGFHYRRLFWLLIFGLIHAYGFWYGDILVVYAMTGAIIYWARRLSPRWLIPLAIFMFAVASGFSVLSGLSMPYWGEEQLVEFGKSWNPSIEVVEHEIAAVRGTLSEQFWHRAPIAFMLETFLFGFLFLWRVGGLMLLGMALYKLRIMDASRSKSFYAWMMFLGLGIGLPLIAYGIHQNNQHTWSIEYSFFLGSQFNYWGSIPVALGYVGMIMLACKTDSLRYFTNRLARTGQMAFTNYLSQSLICSLIFYGHGLGWFGAVSRVQQFVIAMIILLVQIAFSNWWLERFRFGPMEWLWRSLTYFELQPMRERAD